MAVDNRAPSRGNIRVMFTYDALGDQHPFLVAHTPLLLASYRRWLGKELIPVGAGDDPVTLARRLFEAPRVVLSAAADPDRTLQYANAAALALWETDWATITRLPSRETAEPDERAARERLLERVRADGHITDYSGVRISRSGRRFRIHRATVWNLVDTHGHFCGQAATFTEWEMVASPPAAIHQGGEV